jgi:uncharacterized protein YndB with AHSA1/START domain
VTVAVVERVMPAEPDVVYDEWLDPDALIEWMCPRPACVRKASVDARVGGEYRLEVEDSGTRLRISGRYLELERPTRLQFTWFCSVWSPGSDDSIVTVTFARHGDGETLMTIHHEALPFDQIDAHERGWTKTAQQLADRLHARR